MSADPKNPSLPSALKTLTRKFADGWTHHVTGPRTGTLVVGGLSEETDGEGRRHRIEREVSVSSYMLKGCHAATGRALVAVWVHRHGELTKKGALSWALDLAYRGRHDGEHTPQALTAQQLAAYASSRTAAEYAAALDGLAMRKAKRAEVTELRTSVGTDSTTEELEAA